MNSYARMLLLFAAAAAFLNGCDREKRLIDPSVEPDTTFFQDGVTNGGAYYGTTDAVIKDGPVWDILNGNFGRAKLDTIGYSLLGSSLYERRYLVRMEVLIPECAEVLSAKLTLRIEEGTPGAITLRAYEAAVPAVIPGTWFEGSGMTGSGVSWATVDGTASWDAPEGGGDYLLPYLDEQTVSGDTSVTFDLDPDMVFGWLQDPGVNHGVIIIYGGAAGESFLMVSEREASELSERPRLEVIYRPG